MPVSCRCLFWTKTVYAVPVTRAACVPVVLTLFLLPSSSCGIADRTGSDGAQESDVWVEPRVPTTRVGRACSCNLIAHCATQYRAVTSQLSAVLERCRMKVVADDNAFKYGQQTGRLGGYDGLTDLVDD
jgi:hypothetical protein